jgi:hypothetical protein
MPKRLEWGREQPFEDLNWMSGLGRYGYLSIATHNCHSPLISE